MKHFLDALKSKQANLDPSIKDEVAKLLDLRGKMEHILGNIIKK